MLEPREYLSEDAHGFRIVAAGEELREFIPRRRADVVRIWPFLETQVSNAICDEILGRFVPEMVGTSTFETPFRNIPFSTPISQFSALGEVLDEALPEVWKWMKPQLEPGIQTYPRTSRLGWPAVTVVPDKVADLVPTIEMLLSGEEFDFTNSFVQVNVRLQNSDPPGKEREYFFITSEGKIFRHTVNFDDRFDERVGRVASRTRLVFNYPITNLITQCADNTFQRVLLKYPMFHRDMHALARSHWRSRATCVAFDFKHFERVTSFVALKWMKLVGGNYQKLMEAMFWLPFLVPAIGKGRDNWKPFLLTPIPGTMMPQLGSGLSLVSPIQKIAMLAVYAYYFKRAWNLPYDSTIEILVHQGRAERIWNQGDDNFLELDDPGSEAPLYSYLESILPVEVETPTAFLKFLYTLRGFVLAGRSFILNTTNNERQPGSRFRRFSYWGWSQKKKHFSEIGEDVVHREMIPFMNEVFVKYGISLEMLDLEALREYKQIRDEGNTLEMNWKTAIEKTYLLTDEEKALAPREYAVLGKDEVATIVKFLLEA